MTTTMATAKKSAAVVSVRGEREIVVERTFDAPRNLVFAALTKPEILRRWFFGPGGWVLAVCEIDLRVGGALRYVWKRERDGSEMGMGGTYREVVPNERIVFTELFDEPWYPGEAVTTNALVADATRTILTSTTLYASRETRDAVLRSPAYSGVEEAYARLERAL